MMSITINLFLIFYASLVGYILFDIYRTRHTRLPQLNMGWVFLVVVIGVFGIPAYLLKRTRSQLETKWTKQLIGSSESDKGD